MKFKYIFLVMLMVSGAGAWALMSRHVAVPETAPVSAPADEKKKYDPQLLLQFKQACDALDASREEYSIGGSINSTNRADSADVMHDVPFLYARKGKLFYYKLANTETINGNGVCVYIDHGLKRVLLSPEKESGDVSFMPQGDKLKAYLESEGYALSGTKDRGGLTISLVNENHLSCKEYSVTCDTLTMKPTRLYTRLTGNMDTSGGHDKTIEMRLSHVDNRSGIESYFVKPAVTKAGNGWVLTSAYAAYQLIEM